MSLAAINQICVIHEAMNGCQKYKDSLKDCFENVNIKKLIQFLECSWNHEYLGSLAKVLVKPGLPLTLQETRSIYDSMNRPKFEFIAYIYILL